MAEVASDFGTRTWATRRLATPGDPSRTLYVALGSKAIYSSLCIALLLLAPIGESGWQIRLLCGAIAISQPSSDPATWLLRGRERLDIEAIITLVYRAVLSLAMITAASVHPAASAVLVSWLACNVVRSLATTPLWLHRADPARTKSEDSPGVGSVALQSIPLGASLVLAAAFHRLGTLSLAYLHDEQGVATFGTTHRVVSTSALVATSFAVAYYPRLTSAASTGNTIEWNRLLGEKLRRLTLIFAPLALVGAYFLPDVLRIAFGEQLADCQRMIAMMMPGLFLSAINIGTKYALSSYGLDWRDVVCLATGCVVFLAVFAAVHPSSEFSGYETAAVAWVASEAAIFAARRVVLRSRVQESGLGASHVAAGFAVVSAAALLQIYWPN